MSDPRADSVRARLLQRARQHGEDFNLLLTRYALERWLYRLSVSDQRAGFVLKGALVFSLWFDEPHRPTRDADFLGFGAADAELLRERLGKRGLTQPSCLAPAIQWAQRSPPSHNRTPIDAAQKKYQAASCCPPGAEDGTRHR